MHTHHCEDRLPPLQPELHSTTMSQGLPSVDTYTAKLSVRARAKEPASECVRLSSWLTDRPIDAYNVRDVRDGEIAASSLLSVSLSVYLPSVLLLLKWFWGFFFFRVLLFLSHSFISFLYSSHLLISFSLCNLTLFFFMCISLLLSLVVFISLMGPSSLGWAMASSS